MSEFVVITPGTEVDLCEEMNHTSTVAVVYRIGRRLHAEELDQLNIWLQGLIDEKSNSRPQRRRAWSSAPSTTPRLAQESPQEVRFSGSASPTAREYSSRAISLSSFGIVFLSQALCFS